MLSSKTTSLGRKIRMHALDTAQKPCDYLFHSVQCLLGGYVYKGATAVIISYWEIFEAHTLAANCKMREQVNKPVI